ncbi:MAG TPA: DUF1302 family protein [Candidatus Acidoferrales bacterium]|nr:DUF1302 family protein [Candidatus Acidoferrales bacterium]
MKLLLLLAAAACAAAQSFSQRGFLESTGVFYPQTAPNDSGLAVGESLFRYEAFYKLTDLRFAAGIDARFDTHQQTDRSLDPSWFDRTRRRQPLAVRTFNATYTHGKLTFEAGKQLIRWGKADILTPTDRFAPSDFLNVVESDFLPITAARLTYGTQSNTIDLVFEPRLTPSRIPLLNQRWGTPIPIAEAAPDFPGAPQYGARWNHIGAAAEFSFSFYNGFDHLPLFRLTPAFALQRFYPQLRMYGADAAIPLGPVTVKSEAAYFTSTNPQSDEYVLYVLQLERQAGEWSFVAGYAGQAVTDHRSTLGYSPIRGFTRSIVAHASYTIDTNRSISVDAVIHQNGQGEWVRAQYTQAFGQHWRATAGFAIIRGNAADFIGQYNRNSHALLTLRYSF